MLFVTSDVVYGISLMVTVVAVVLVLPSVVDDDSSESEVEVEAVSEVALSELAHEFIFRLKKKISIISINTSFR